MARWDVKVKEYKEYKEYEVPPAGAIPARVCAMIDIGTHDTRSMDGKLFKRRMLILGFELSKKDSQGNPFYLSKSYTLSMGTSSNLFAVVRSLYGDTAIGTSLDSDWIANKPCLLQITHDHKTKNGKERTYAKIDGIMGVPEGLTTPKGRCEVWRISDTSPIPDLSHLPPLWNDIVGQMLTIPEWAEASDEMQSWNPDDRPEPATSRKPAPPVTQEEADDEIPF